MSSCEDLLYLNCNSNSISDLLIQMNDDLTHLYCEYNQISSLSLASHTELISVNCRNNLLNELILENNNKIRYLNCGRNNISEIDLSSLLLLEQLYIENNFISDLNLLNNFSLKRVYCKDNEIYNLNLSHNLLLSELDCSLNHLSTLDLHFNTELSFFHCKGNYLTTLNLKNGNNGNLWMSTYNLNFEWNANLICILVDDESFSNQNWFNIDPQSYFSEDCYYLNTGGIKEFFIDVFPNPVNNGTNIYTSVKANYVLTNINGAVIKDGELFSGDNYLELSELITGVYFLVAKSDNSQTIKKIIKN